MRSSRLLSLVLLLADGRTYSAACLAKRFGVSARSLYRDMDLLSGLGIPLESIPGRDGGYRIMPGFALERSVLDEGELAAVTAALGGIGRATGDRQAEGARSKLRALLAKSPERRRSWIRIELAEGARGHIETLRSAIEESRLVLLRYRDAEGATTERRVEPAAVVYLWQSWYLWAYCRLREGWRLFKLARVDSAHSLLSRFEPRTEPTDTAWREAWESKAPTSLLLEIAPEAVPRAVEWFEAVERRPGGGALVRARLPDNEWLYGFLLSFGPGLRVLEPERVGTELAARARRIWLAYQVSGGPDGPGDADNGDSARIKSDPSRKH
ncbi:MAG: YafY family transcriptional regulator [Spirochaetaceae bacterium]|nr:YafY family transcriptional regulator [Spirochaetaceae bacterium]